VDRTRLSLKREKQPHRGNRGAANARIANPRFGDAAHGDEWKICRKGLDWICNRANKTEKLREGNGNHMKGMKVLAIGLRFPEAAVRLKDGAIAELSAIFAIRLALLQCAQPRGGEDETPAGGR
jgi:hypothetical protein